MDVELSVVSELVHAVAPYASQFLATFLGARSGLAALQHRLDAHAATPHPPAHAAPPDAGAP